jgi:hypothetical protein
MHLFDLTDLILQLIYLLLSLAVRGELLELYRIDTLNLPDDVFGFLVVGVGTGDSAHKGED